MDVSVFDLQGRCVQQMLHVSEIGLNRLNKGVHLVYYKNKARAGCLKYLKE
jgi:hypothetical protein